ncbi:NAD(P)-dependent alcohol dehydrogenase [Agromyces sp. NPDC058126]|uniref:NAD(P)-dependent alcohol dehydrogenase n=1 Tax=Agromyces sp. NPDC058126 TaxID=3346350 RepID=UPI0036DD18CF
MKITAAVLRHPSDTFKLEPVALRAPLDHEILVRIVSTGLCHTDLLPRASLVLSAPMVLGHEGAGVVEAVGSSVESLAPGDHVVLTFDWCGACGSCVQGLPGSCSSFVARNLTGFDTSGGTTMADEAGDPIAAHWFGQSSFASHVLVAEQSAIRVDPRLPLSLLAPLGCSVQTGAGTVLRVLRVRAESSIIVSGVGAVGLVSVMAARAAGARTIVAVDIDDSRLDKAKAFGATHTVNPKTHDISEVTHEACPSGADYGIDTTGKPDVIGSVLRALDSRGSCALIGLMQGGLSLDATSLATGRTLIGVVEGGSNPHTLIPELIRLWKAGSLPFDELIQHFTFDEINEAEAQLRAGTVIKPVLLQPK